MWRVRSAIVIASAVTGITAAAAGSADAAPLRRFLISPTSIDFGDVSVGLTSAAQNITVTNVSPAPVVVNLSGGGAGDFGGVSTCQGVTLAPAQSCQITYRFTPPTPGPDTATAKGTINGQPFVFNLTGNGVRRFQITPTALDFGDVVLGHSSPNQTVTVTNVSATAATIALTGASIVGPFGGTQACNGVPLNPGQSCQLMFQFTPRSAGSAIGDASGAINGQPFDVPLAGNGYVNTPGDLDGDGRTDLGTYRPSTGEWSFVQSGTNTTATHTFGQSTDRPVPGDYDGDGKLDLAFWRPSTGEWFVATSSSGFVNIIPNPWGTATDIPVPGDYDGDGITDLAVFRPSNGTWYIFNSKTQLPVYQQWGTSTDVPVPADYDGDGKIDIAVFRPSTGTWFIIPSSTGIPYSVQWGASDDLTVPADYDGDGKADIAVFRPSDGTWYIVSSKTGTPILEQWGASGDIPVPGDYDGDGKTDIAVWRPSTATWFVINSSTGAPFSQQWGLSGDIPIPETYFGRWVP